jgi:hypothetical protein
MKIEKKDGFTIRDRRGKDGDEPKEVCRVCGSKVVHSREYNHPTMECIQYLRKVISTLGTI